MIKVRLIAKGTKNTPVTGKKVTISGGAFGMLQERTNGAGEAAFNVTRGHYQVFVDGKKRHDGLIADVCPLSV